MIKAEQAVIMVKEFQNAREERKLKEANDFVERVVSPKIEGVAKSGGRMFDLSVARGIDGVTVSKILVDNGYNILGKADPREMTVSW